MNDRMVLGFRIQPGQVQVRKVARGSRITITAGAVRVEGPPQWLADMVVRSVSLAHPGEPVTLQQGGWVALSSELGAHALIGPAVRPILALAALRTLARSWRRRIGATSPFHAA